MSNTTRVDAMNYLAAFVAGTTILAASAMNSAMAQPSTGGPGGVAGGERMLSAKQQAIAPISAATAVGDIGTANQTQLIGAPARGPLFEFSPVIDEYLKSHLFGAMFARNNLDWQSRELATVGALAALPGVESQLQSHVGFSLNVGLTGRQLEQLADGLARSGHPEAAARARAAMAQVEAAKK